MWFNSRLSIKKRRVVNSKLYNVHNLVFNIRSCQLQHHISYILKAERLERHEKRKNNNNNKCVNEDGY